MTATPVLQFTIYFKPDFFNTIGASRPLPSVRVKVPSPNPERTLALGTRTAQVC